MKQRFPKIWQIVCIFAILCIAMTQTGVVYADGTPPPDGTEEPTEEPTAEVTPEPEEPQDPTEEPESTPIPGDLELVNILGDLELMGGGDTEESEGEEGEAETPPRQVAAATAADEPEDDVFDAIIDAFIDGLAGGGDVLDGILPDSTSEQGQMLLGMISDELTAAGASPDDPDFAENLNDIVEALAAQGLTLFNDEGSPLPLVSEIARDVLVDADPMGCPDGVLPVWLGGSGDGCTASYTSIQDAIDDDLVQDGWTIFIQEGIFSEQVEVSKSVRLLGQAGTILRAPTELTKFHGDNEYFMIGVQEKVESIIEGMVIDGMNMMPTLGGFSGISFFGATGGIFNNEIRNFAYGAGVSINKSTDVTVAGNDIHDNEEGVEVVSSALVDVVDNQVHDNQVGIGSYISGLVDISGNVVEDNVVGIKSQSSLGVGITENIIDDNVMGVKIYDSAEVTVAGNQITNNNIGVSNTFGLFNTITENQISDNDVGVVNMLSLATDISRNQIVDNGVGVVNGLTLFTNISENRIADNGVGLVNVISVGTHVHFNEIEDNGVGVINANMIFPVYGQYNWWGCNEGPGAKGCNGIIELMGPNFRFRPWLTDFDFDGVYTMYDNCPFVYNPDQMDSDFNGVGDACEPVTWSGPIMHYTGFLIPTTGAKVVQLKCGATTTLKLPDGSIAMVDNLCGYSANLSGNSAQTVPSAMSPLGAPTYMNLEFLQSAVPSTARFSYSFAVPASLKGERFKVIYWDDEQGIWVTIPYRLIINGEVVSVPLYRDHPDSRIVLDGVYTGSDGMIHFMTNFPGVFVMVLDP